MKQISKYRRGPSRFPQNGMVFVGPAMLEEEFAVLSILFERFYLPSHSQCRVLRRFKLADLVQNLAD